MTSFVILDQTKQYKYEDLVKISNALKVQLNRDFSPIYGGNYDCRVSKDGSDIVKGEIVAAIIATSPPNVPADAIAWHSEDGSTGIPNIFVSLLALGARPLSVSLSHEMLEEAGDPACNRWADNFNAKEFAFEICDATESDTYDIDGVPVSNFLYPSFFDANGSAPYSHIGAVTGTDPVSGPFQTARGGYQDVRTVSNDAIESFNARGQKVIYPGTHHHARVYGEAVDPKRREYKEIMRGHWSSRFNRRARGKNTIVPAV